MMTRRHCWKIFLLIGLLIPSILLKGQELATTPDTLSDRATVSLLVAAPSPEEVYTLYGHVGLRLEDEPQGVDITFNYGIFSFDDDFLYNFVKGEDNYLVAAIPTQSYIDGYLSRGSQVSELVLNLPPKTINLIWTYLLWNIQPEHAKYSYNFFYDNCSTRPLGIIDRAVAISMSEVFDNGTTLNARIHYPSEGSLPERSWRQEINTLQASNQWLVLATDVLLGAPADEAMTMQERAFSPRNLRWLLEHSTINVGDTSRPALRSVRTYTPDVVEEIEEGISVAEVYAFLTHPAWLVIGLLCGALLMPLLGIYLRWWHVGLLTLLGVIGVLVIGVSFALTYPLNPLRFSNFNVFVFSPLFLFCALALGLRPRSRITYVLVLFSGFVCPLTVALVAVFNLQAFNPVVYLFAVMLLVFADSYRRRY